MPECPLCSREEAAVERDPGGALVFHVQCPRCGRYTVTSTAEPGLATYEGRDRDRLMGSIRNATERGAGPVELTTVTTPRIVEEAKPPRNPNEALDLLLQHAERRTERPGHRFSFTTDDYPLLYTNDQMEFDYYVQYAQERGFIQAVTQGYFQLTPLGWERLDELRRTGVRPDQAFVAMWFHDDVEAAWEEGIRPALEEAGYDAVRVDLVEHNEKICDRIIAEIRRSGLLVADFTGHRQGVYFEAGFALGLGIPVIYTCRADQLDDAHFDTRQYNHIRWSDPGELRERLRNRVRATTPLPGMDA